MLVKYEDSVIYDSIVIGKDKLTSKNCMPLYSILGTYKAKSLLEKSLWSKMNIKTYIRRTNGFFLIFPAFAKHRNKYTSNKELFFFHIIFAQTLTAYNICLNHITPSNFDIC